MNLISNTCTGALVYRDYFKSPYNNPFCWNFIDAENYYNLIINFENINFSNYDLIRKDTWKFYIKIDNLVTVYYPHYRFSKYYNKVTQIKDDVFYNKIWEYIVEKYESRAKRMINLNEVPVFIVGSTNKGQLYSKEQFNKFFNITTKKLFIFTKEPPTDIPANITVIDNFDYDWSNKNAAKIIYSLIEGGGVQ